MYIHKEGYPTITLVSSLFIGMLVAAIKTEDIASIIFWIVTVGLLVLLGLVLWFFRMPTRKASPENGQLLCPADGKVVVIEKTVEKEYFKDERIQVSIFMSPLNVHAQWYPCKGKVNYTQYHKGKFLVAWHPKSSELNERSTVVICRPDGKEILVRQIAGAVARRIVTYSKTNTEVNLNDELGFIKFGSRVDIFLPLDTDIKVAIDDKVTGNETVLAYCQ